MTADMAIVAGEGGTIHSLDQLQVRLGSIGQIPSHHFD